MIVGIGTDIVSTKRVARIYKQFGKRFIERILHPMERVDLANSNHKAAFLARRFAAKEATCKALGTGLRYGIGWQNICITHNHDDAPQLILHMKAATIATQQAVGSTFLSIADEKDYAVAFVILAK